MNNLMSDNLTLEDFKRMHMHMGNSIKDLASVHDHNLHNNTDMLNNNNNHNTDIHNMHMHILDHHLDLPTRTSATHPRWMTPATSWRLTR